ncbi:MAG: 2OG-Fe(II) oxygenase family protein [Steroidobacteraceae bacterium]
MRQCDMVNQDVDRLHDEGALWHGRAQLERAIACYRAALSVDPNALETRSNLAHALLEMGRQREAWQMLQDAPGPQRVHPTLLATAGALHCAEGRYAAAIDILNPLTRSGRVDEMPWVNLATCQRELGDEPGALTSLREACDINPDNARAQADLVGLLLSLGRAAEALEIADAFLERHPEDRQLLAVTALALQELGRTDEAREICDIDSMIDIIDRDELDLPPGLLQELADYLCTEPSLLQSPLSKATRGGSQTGELDPALHPGLLAIESWAKSLLPAELRGWRWWATILEAGGRQLPHIHPRSSWSGVFYVALPEELQQRDPGAGALEFGMPPAHLRLRFEPVTRIVAPMPGRLVIFPSHLWHRTLDFDATGRRISVAFDAVDQDSGV